MLLMRKLYYRITRNGKKDQNAANVICGTRFMPCCFDLTGLLIYDATNLIYYSFPGMQNWIGYNWLKILAIIMIVGALQTWITLPYAYFQLMNWIVVGASIVSAYRSYHLWLNPFMWLFIFVAVVFNPLAPIYLSQDIWKLADVIAIALIILSFLFIKRKR